MNVIRTGWEAYRDMVVPKDAGPAQVVETERAFYAGSKWLFDAILQMLDPGGEEPTEQDLQKMQAVADELQAYRETIGRTVN